jgi:hypothetical protein
MNIYLLACDCIQYGQCFYVTTKNIVPFSILQGEEYV